MRRREQVRALMNAVRVGPFTGLGCYPTFFLMSDGGTLSHEAVKAELWRIARATRDGGSTGWEFVALDINWENPDMICDHTGKRIESAYAEPEENNEGVSP